MAVKVIKTPCPFKVCYNNELQKKKKKKFQVSDKVVQL